MSRSNFVIAVVAALLPARLVGQPSEGAISVSPIEAIAGTFQEITYTFHLGSQKMVRGGGIRIEYPVAYGETEPFFWSKPQTEYPDAPGYVAATSSDGSLLRVTAGGIAGGIATIELESDTLQKGDSITMVYRGIVQSLARDVEVRYAVRNSATGEWRRAPHPPTFSILPREAHTLVATTPSDVQKGTSFSASVVLIDRYGNLASGYRGTITLSSTDPNSTLPASYEFSETDKGIHIFDGVQFDAEGFQQIRAAAPGTSIQVSSNYTWVWPGEPPFRRFFGDTHFHTGSGTRHHGFIGASTSGDINTLATEDFQSLNSGGDHRGNFTDAASAYRYARDVVRLDFASSSEHDAVLFDSLAWAESQAISERFNNSGKFTTFFAYEWTAGFMHHIVLYRFPGGKVFKHADYPDLPSLWHALDDQGMPALTIPHVTWTFDDHPIWDEVNNTYRRVGEIYSLWNSRFLVQPDDIPQRFELGVHNRWSYQYAWDHGHRLGLVGATDNHLGRPGANNYTIYTQHTGGFAGVLAPENTRDAIWDGLQNRRTYATTGTRIYLDFQADGHEMGSEYTATAPPKISVRVAGTNTLASVEIVKYQAGAYETIFEDRPDSAVSVFTFTDDGFESDCFYYLRVKQVDEYPGRPWSHSTAEMAWSSPIWVTNGSGGR
ncbi:MAG: DUF3604 domain-containing protein [Rhodothermales bacterium]